MPLFFSQKMNLGSHGINSYIQNHRTNTKAHLLIPSSSKCPAYSLTFKPPHYVFCLMLTSTAESQYSGIQRWKKDLRRPWKDRRCDLPRPSFVTPLPTATINASRRAILNNKGTRTRVVNSEQLSVPPVRDHTGQKDLLGMFHLSPFWVFMRHTKFNALSLGLIFN